MIERSKHYVVSNLASVAYRHATVVLKMAAGIDETYIPGSTHNEVTFVGTGTSISR